MAASRWPSIAREFSTRNNSPEFRPLQREAFTASAYLSTAPNELWPIHEHSMRVGAVLDRDEMGPGVRSSSCVNKGNAPRC